MLPALLIGATESARAEIQAAHDDAAAERQIDREAGLRHALHILRTFESVRQSLRQLRGYAGCCSNSIKAAAYREAFDILTRHTGETPAESRPKHDPEIHPALF